MKDGVRGGKWQKHIFDHTESVDVVLERKRKKPAASLPLSLFFCLCSFDRLSSGIDFSFSPHPSHVFCC